MKRREVLHVITGITLIMSSFSISMLSGTLAKYASSVTAESSAVVADFSFEMSGGKLLESTGSVNQNSTSAASFNLFDSVRDDTGIKNTAGSSTVLIAPGSSGKFNIKFTNNSEVAVKTSYEISLTNGSVPGIITGLPVVIKFNGRYYSDGLAGRINVRHGNANTDLINDAANLTGPISGTGSNTLSDAVSKHITAFGPKIGSAAATGTFTYEFEWFWVYDGRAGTASNPGQTDTIDTAFLTIPLLEPVLTIANKVEQLDNFTKSSTTRPQP